MLQGLCEGQLERSLDLIGRVCKRLWSSYRLGRGHNSVSYSDAWSYAHSSEYGSTKGSEGRGVAQPVLDKNGSWKTPHPPTAASSGASAHELRDWLWGMIGDKQRGIMELLVSILATDDGYRAERVASLLTILVKDCVENQGLARRRYLVRVRAYLLAKIYFDELVECEDSSDIVSSIYKK